MPSNNYPRTRQVLESLIGGVDPATGCDLPKHSILNRVDVIRALIFSVEHARSRRICCASRAA